MSDVENEKLKKQLNDYINTVKAMVFAARGGECDTETLQKEMDAVSTKPSEYIRFIVSSKNDEIAKLRASLTVLASQKTTAEMSEQEKQDADGCYEEAYDMMVAHARRALAPEGG